VRIPIDAFVSGKLRPLGSTQPVVLPPVVLELGEPPVLPVLPWPPVPPVLAVELLEAPWLPVEFVLLPCVPALAGVPLDPVEAPLELPCPAVAPHALPSRAKATRVVFRIPRL
jgi:hypothetical protein